MPVTRQLIRDKDLAVVYFVLQLFSFELELGDDRWFVHDTLVAQALGTPYSLGLRMFDSEEPTMYHFPANNNPDFIVTDDDGNLTQTLVEITKPLKSGLNEYQVAVSMVLGTRALFSTKEGYIGLGPKGMAQEDEVVVFEGA